MKKVLRIVGVIVILFATTLLVLRGIMGISFVMGDKTFYPPAGQMMTADKKAFSFVVLADTGSQNRTLEQLINEAKKNKPDFVLHLGDLVVYRNMEHMYWIMDEIDNKLGNIPMYLVPGNHDVKRKKKVDKAPWQRVFGPTYYWFSYGRVLFIALDSSTEAIDEEQWAFFEHVMRLIRPYYKQVILFTHVPPSVPDGMDAHNLKPEHVKKMAQMLKKYPVDAIFTGHVHYYSKQDFNGIPVYTTPPSGQYFRGSVHKFGYLVVDVTPEKIEVRPLYSERKKASEWLDIMFIDLILTNKVRWIAGFVLLAGLVVLLSGQKWLRFSWLKGKKN